MNYLLSVLVFLIIGCASFYRAPGIYPQPQFKAYTNAYLEYKQIYLGTKQVDYPIEVYMWSLEGSTAGVCSKYDSYRTRSVKVDPIFWDNISEEARLSLIFHELGHCDLDLDHQEKIPGIMNSKLYSKFLEDKVIEGFFREGL